MLKSKQVIVFAEKSIGIEEIRQHNNRWPYEPSAEKKKNRNIIHHNAISSWRRNICQKRKKIKVSEQNNFILSDDDDDITDKENDEIECF